MMSEADVQRAIRWTCSHCQRDSYFVTSLSIEAISSSTCVKCGHTQAVITLNIEAPRDAVIHDRITRRVLQDRP